jgi:hypothetical protein
MCTNNSEESGVAICRAEMFSTLKMEAAHSLEMLAQVVLK